MAKILLTREEWKEKGFFVKKGRKAKYCNENGQDISSKKTGKKKLYCARRN